MAKLSAWIRSHPLATLVIAVALFYFSRSFLHPLLGLQALNRTATSSVSFGGAAEYASPSLKSLILPPSPPGDSTDPSVPASERLVVTDTNLSLLVNSVRQAISAIKSQAESTGGFMVNSSLSAPEEATTGTLIVRVPSASLDEFLEFTRTQAVRVVSENIHGRDVTDQYQNIEARLATLQNTKTTFEGILARATTVDEILRVQKSIFQVQDQIDALIGQKQYLENTSATSLVTLHLATDELALPYAPATPWRPAVVFKTAVRSLTLTLRQISSAAIWIAVYSILWLPALALFWFFAHRRRPRQ